jgi:hypothetical protein
VTGATDEPGTASPPDSQSDLLGQPFRLDSITEVPAPEGAEGTWQQYVIVQGTNTINGLRAGTLSEVKPQIEEIVRHLNERFMKAQAGAASGYGRKPPPSRGGRRNPEPKPIPTDGAANSAGTSGDSAT